MSSIPLSGQWSMTRPGLVELEVPAPARLTVIIDDRGSHLSLSFTRHQAEQALGILHAVLSIGNERGHTDD
jgi:hypothetical protein